MQQSMTGFCHLTETFNNKLFQVDIKCLNSKQLDLNVRLPILFKELEQPIRTLVSNELKRGKIDLIISFEWIELPVSTNLNKAAFKTYFNHLKEIKNELDLDYNPDWLSLLIRLPDVVQTSTIQPTDDEKNKVLQLVNDGIQKVIEFRKHEGEVLMNDILMRIQHIKDSLSKIESFEQQRIENIKTRLLNALNEIHADFYDKNRFEQELLYYLEKMDITEEKTRILSHCRYFEEVSYKETQAGRKLSFIVQELGREINTLGSKAQDVNIQQQVVIMKDELEKVKEQLMNIL